MWPATAVLQRDLEGIRRNPGPLVVEWQGEAFRMAARDYADEVHFTDGEGARRFGGRFTPLGSFRTIYLSLDEPTCAAELNFQRLYYGTPASAFRPRVLAAVAVSVGLVLDLTNPDTLARLGLTPELLREQWRPETDAGSVAPVQAFGALVRGTGFEGLIVHSVPRPDGQNLVLFPDNFKHGSHAVMINP